MTETRASASPGRSFLRRPTREPTAIDGVLETYHRMYPKAKTALIEQAYAVAKAAHEGQLRKSGEPYITHPIAVAQIIADLGLPDSVIAAALLHDVVEDTEHSLDQIREQFGDEVAMIVDGVTKLDKVKYGDAAQAETVRKMVVAMAKDIRVLLLKLCDRLHNARTWEFVAPESARRKAQETLEIYAPLAHRMGLNAIKWELEDLSFKTLYPKIYQEIVDVVTDRAPEREKYLDASARGDRQGPQVHEDQGRDHGPPKALLLGLPEDDRARPRPRRHLRPRRRAHPRGLGARLLRGAWRDARAVPAGSRPVQGLHRDAQVQPLPVAAHHGDRAHGQASGAADSHVGHAPPSGVRPRRALALQGRGARRRHGQRSTTRTWAGCARSRTGSKRPRTRASSSTRCAARSRDAEVYVFTPRGKLLALPQGATPVDFAYAVHTEVGHKTIGARVNGRLVPLDSTLDNGDTVEVLTSSDENAHPKRDWLEFVAVNESAQQDSPMVHARAPRGVHRDRARHARARHPPPAPADAAPHEQVHAARPRKGNAIRGRRLALRGHRRAQGAGVRRRREDDRGRWRGRGRGRGRHRDHAARPAAARPQGRSWRLRHGPYRRGGQARAVLHAGSRGPDPRLRDARLWGVRAPRRIATTLRDSKTKASVSSTSSGRGRPRRPSWCRSRSRRSTATASSAM